MHTDLTMRTLNFKKDYDKLIPFLDLVFKEELSREGADISEMLKGFKSMIPLIKFFGIFSKNLRHLLDGFVIDNEEGKIIATITTSNGGNYWEIGMVATHPDYRRKGLAKKLVMKAIEYTKAHNVETCILEVISDNEPAYNLYRSLGFTHFDSLSKFKLEPERLLTLDKKSKFPNGYVISKKLNRNKKTSLERYELALRETPKDVKAFLPIDKNKYNDSKAKKILRPIAKRLFGVSIHCWLVHHNGQLVGTLCLEITQKEKGTHKLSLKCDPIHREKISEPLILLAMEKLREITIINQNTLIDVRSSYTDVLNLLNQLNFIEYEKNHILGLKIANYNLDQN